jgi:uncharacterized membrane protein
MIVGTVVDWDSLLEVVWVSLAAGVGVTAAFAFALLGSTRAIETGREGRSAEAAIYAAVGVLGFAVVVVAIVFGIVVMAD